MFRIPIWHEITLCNKHKQITQLTVMILSLHNDIVHQGLKNNASSTHEIETQ